MQTELPKHPTNPLEFEVHRSVEQNPNGCDILFLPELGVHGLPAPMEQLLGDHRVNSVTNVNLMYGLDEHDYAEALRTQITQTQLNPERLIIVGFSSGSIAALNLAAELGIPSERVILAGPAVIPLPKIVEQRLNQSFPNLTSESRMMRTLNKFSDYIPNRGGLAFAKRLMQQFVIDKTRLAIPENATEAQAIENAYRIWIAPERLQQLLQTLHPVVLVGSNDKISRTSKQQKFSDYESITVPNAGHSISDYLAEVSDYLQTL